MSLSSPSFRKSSRKGGKRKKNNLRQGLSTFWTELNRGPDRSKPIPWFVPRVPSIMNMAVRCFALFLVNLVVWSLEIIFILGENVFWSFKFVDTIYSNIGTNQFDVSTYVVVMTWFLIWGIGGWWVVGFFDRWFE